LVAGRTYIIDMKALPGSNFDPYLRLETATGQVLAEDDDSGGGLDARITFRATQTGNYNLIATSFSPQFGPFTLTVVEQGGGVAPPRIDPKIPKVDPKSRPVRPNARLDEPTLPPNVARSLPANQVTPVAWIDEKRGAS